MNNFNRIIFCILFAATMQGCSGGGGDSENPCSDLNLKVYGGEQCKYEQSPVIALVALDAYANPIGVCSATMVTVDDALTAAHCIELAFMPGAVEVIAFVNNEIHGIVNAAVHPYWDRQVDSPFDLAMITIDRPINIGPVPLFVSDPLLPGENITVYGYGRYKEGTDLEEITDFRAAFMKASIVDQYKIQALFDITHTSICQGDSGGPAVQNINGMTGIVGVTSYTYNGCVDNSVSGFVNMQNPLNYEFVRAYAPDVSIR